MATQRQIQELTDTSEAEALIRSVPAGNNIHIVDPLKGQKKRAHKKSVVDIVGQTDDAFLDQVGGFVNFLQEYAVVGLALGFIVGQQANGVVKQLVASFMDPLFQVWFGQTLSSRVAILHHNQTIVKVPWGAFVYTLLEFFFVLFMLYVIIKLFKLDKFTKKKDVSKK